MKKTTKRDKYLRSKYSITEAIYKNMLAAQGGVCAICSRAPKGLNLNVDHDHKTGQVRGLLCFFCNKYMIGRRRREHVVLFERAAAYLASTKDWRVP
jgi:hypothetical protein